jgi:hypothetical protein
LDGSSVRVTLGSAAAPASIPQTPTEKTAIVPDVRGTKDVNPAGTLVLGSARGLIR